MLHAPLRLLAHDSEDLAVVALHMKHAVLRVGDMTFLPKERRFVLVAERFNWLAAGSGQMQCVEAGLHFDGVLEVATSGFDASARDTALSLDDIVFSPGDAPGGWVIFKFSSGGSLRLTVECLDAQLRDLGARWQTSLASAVPAADDPA